VLSFKKKAKELIARAKTPDNPTSAAGGRNGIEVTNKTFPIGGTKPVTKLTASGDDRVVLTLYGNAPNGPKQLFSSLQEQVGEVGVAPPLREAGLPNGISTTQIVPLHSTGLVEEKKRTTTYGELYGPSTTIAPLQPPKPAKNGTTRSSVVGWYKPGTAEPSRSRSSSYFSQNITTGQWLEYSTALSSPDIKRKQRERALSLSGGKLPLPESDTDQEALELDSLYRRCYSGFAPSKDDSAAIAPTETVDRIWWQQVGRKMYKQLLDRTPDVEATVKTEPTEETIQPLEEVDVDAVEDAIANWVPVDQAIDPSLENNEKSIEEREVEEVLQGISELLETLNSYQRNRNLSLNATSRPAGALAFQDSSSASNPTKPTESELATYNILKSQLSLMISSLPPFAVAKLNSDQLAELSISTKIPIPADDHKGAMEEDEATARAKVIAMTAASASRPPPSATGHRSTSATSLYGNQYSSNSRPTVSSPHSYYGTQTPVRPPSTNMARPPATAQGLYGNSRPAPSTGYHPQSAYSKPQYPHQVPRPSQSQYGTSSQQYYQTPAAPAYAQNAYQPAPQTAPQANINGPYRTGPPAPFPQRPPPTPNGMAYQYNNGVNVNRQASPQKGIYNSPQPSAAQPANRAPYSTPTPAMSGDRRYFQPPMTNGHAPASPMPQTQTQTHVPAAPQTPGFVGATGYHTVMTPADQSALMERQRTQLANQHSTQHSARTAAQAGAIGATGQPSATSSGGN
jgi:hypothetical protein